MIPGKKTRLKIAICACLSISLILSAFLFPISVPYSNSKTLPTTTTTLSPSPRLQDSTLSPTPTSTSTPTLSLQTSPLNSPLVSQQAGDDVIETRVLALEKAGVTKEEIDSALGKIKSSNEGLSDIKTDTKTQKVKVFETDKEHASELINALKATGLFDSVDKDVLNTLFSGAYTNSPNDYAFTHKFNITIGGQPYPDFDVSYGLRGYPGSEFDKVWEGLSEAGEYDSAPIAVLDAGVDLTLPDFSNSNIVAGWGSEKNSTDVYPYCGSEHGNFTTSEIGAETNNAIGIAGAAYDTKVIAYNVAQTSSDKDKNCSIPNSYVIDAIARAYNAGARIMSMSFGSDTYEPILDSTIQEYAARGVVFVAAAGNSKNSTLHYPASYNNVLSVAATDQAGNHASFSTYNNKVDISAGGVAVVGIDSTSSDTGYINISAGTSMSTPYVAAAASLIMRYLPNLSASEVVGRITKYANSSILSAANGCPAGIPVKNCFGAGVLDVRAAIEGKAPTPIKCPAGEHVENDVCVPNVDPTPTPTPPPTPPPTPQPTYPWPTLPIKQVNANSARFMDLSALSKDRTANINWLYKYGVTTGSPQGSNTYKPQDLVNRGSMAQFMHRVIGMSRQTKDGLNFTDISVLSKERMSDISWLASEGITQGSPKGSNTYRPSDPVNRGAMAEFMYRLAKSPKYTPPKVSESPFDDIKGLYNTNYSRYKAICWAKSIGITLGSPSGSRTYRPSDPVNRGAMADFLHRLYGYLVKG
jgi:serine protease